MYEYLRELHRLFNTQPANTSQQEQLEQLRTELKHHLSDDDGRKLLLRLTDATDVLNYEISLESFAAGFRLAYGLTCELSAGRRFSYEEAEASRICQAMSR